MGKFQLLTIATVLTVFLAADSVAFRVNNENKRYKRHEDDSIDEPITTTAEPAIETILTTETTIVSDPPKSEHPSDETDPSILVDPISLPVSTIQPETPEESKNPTQPETPEESKNPTQPETPEESKNPTPPEATTADPAFLSQTDAAPVDKGAPDSPEIVAVSSSSPAAPIIDEIPPQESTNPSPPEVTESTPAFLSQTDAVSVSTSSPDSPAIVVASSTLPPAATIQPKVEEESTNPTPPEVTEAEPDFLSQTAAVEIATSAPESPEIIVASSTLPPVPLIEEEAPQESTNPTPPEVSEADPDFLSQTAAVQIVTSAPDSPEIVVVDVTLPPVPIIDEIPPQESSNPTPPEVTEADPEFLSQTDAVPLVTLSPINPAPLPIAPIGPVVANPDEPIVGGILPGGGLPPCPDDGGLVLAPFPEAVINDCETAEIFDLLSRLNVPSALPYSPNYIQPIPPPIPAAKPLGYAPSPNGVILKQVPQSSAIDPEIAALIQFAHSNYPYYEQTLSSGMRPPADPCPC